MISGRPSTGEPTSWICEGKAEWPSYSTKILSGEIASLPFENPKSGDHPFFTVDG
jgi:hypothetical protein